MIKKLHIAYFVCSFLLYFCASLTTRSQTILTPGDIAVLGLNADDPYPNQRWAFMTMRTISAGTIIHFTDKGYDGSTGNFRLPVSDPFAVENDGFMTWVVPSTIPVGTVIYATNTTINGSANGVSGQLGNGTTLGFVGSGDQIIIYQGTSGSTLNATFIYAINTGQHTNYNGNGSWTTSGVVDQDYFSYLPPGLTNGSTALSLVSDDSNLPSGSGVLGAANYGFDNMYYGGITTGTKAQLLAAIANPTSWVGNNLTAFNLATGSGIIPVGAFVILPVTLLHFNAQKATDGTVELSWSTAMEVNNNHFTLERSGDGLHYTAIGTVQGKGDNNQPVGYTFTDQSPEQGSNYYRLTQTDHDGKSKILGNRTVEVTGIALRVGPNPAVLSVDVAFNRGVWREIKLYNNAQQLLQTISPRVTTSKLKIGLQNYRPGTYYLAFTGKDGQSAVKRFVKRE